ncbi:response regulator transcription factor [Sphingobacterium thalpophilum]|uniref:Probable transcriptional regulatory protein NarL n=1 Tax=Sphingobacterium thalpophilum TaxID=259 RepID=A0A4U9VQV1_9SPHI|nr:response regulator transcription factor [Sphingobacterium thalpophilum]VTR45891.1 Probable transcriptional regulatory protein NarL [Sphingobacterium thalpophilum]
MNAIAILDDHPLLLEGVVAFLSQQGGYTVYPFSQEATLHTFLAINTVDLVLLDMQLMDKSGLDVCVRLKQLRPTIPVLALSNVADRNLIYQFIQKGGDGYILKDASNEEFLRCIRFGLAGQEAFSDRARELYSEAEETFRALPRLTSREKEILQLIADGLTSNQIAERLFLSPVTVETHRRNLLTKFKVKNMIELVRLAMKNHLLGM